MTRSVGILLGRTEASVCLMRKVRMRRVVAEAEGRFAIDPELWTSERPNFRSVFRKAARLLGANARRADTGCHIAIPDAAVLEVVLNFRELPEAEKERAQLVALRAAREVNRKPTDLAVSFQLLSSGPDGIEVLSRLIDVRLSDAILQAARRSGFRVTMLEGLSRYLSLPPAPKEPGILGRAVVGTDGWTLVLSEPGSGHSRVWSDWGAEDQDAALAERMVRLAKTYALNRQAAPEKLVLGISPVAADARNFAQAVQNRLPDAGVVPDQSGATLHDLAREVARP